MVPDDINHGLTVLRSRHGLVELYGAYDEGRHRLGLASSKMRTAFKHLFSAFALNLCPPVIDAVADRLQVLGFSDPGESGGMNEAAASVWAASRMDVQAGQVHREALVTGDAYVIVWPDSDDNQPILYPQGRGEVMVRYDPGRPGSALYALKAWRDDTGRYRVTVYYPHQIERYVTRQKAKAIPEKAAALEPIADDPVVQNVWRVVPVFHFANDAPVGRHGRSELRDVIPLQDALNKTVIDVMVGGEYQALPQRWGTGIEEHRDEHGRVTPVAVDPGSLMAGPKDARFGQFAAADLTQLLNVKTSFAGDIGSVTGTPRHLLIGDVGGGWPSGEALKTSEARLVKRCQDRIAEWGPVWADAMTLALRMAQHPVAVRTVMDSPETRESPLDAARAALAKQQAGIPQRQTWRELGYSEDQIKVMWEERLEEQAASAEAAARAFNAGAGA